MMLPNFRQQMMLIIAGLIVGIFLLFAQVGTYDRMALSSYIESLNLGIFEAEPLTYKKPGFKYTDNTDPEIIEKHRVEAKVNRLLKDKVNEEIKKERLELEASKKNLNQQIDNFAKEQTRLSDSKKGVSIDHRGFQQLEPKFSFDVFSFISNSDEKLFDPRVNENIVFVTINGFGPRRKYEDLLKLIDKLGVEPFKTTLALLINDEKLYSELFQHFSKYYDEIPMLQDAAKEKRYFTKVVLLETQFLEKDISIADAEISKLVQKRKALARAKNFLISNSLGNEQYALFLDSDIEEVPENMFKVMRDSKKDIAAVRVESKGADSKADLGSWTGKRKKPTDEQQDKMDQDDSFVFTPEDNKEVVYLKGIANDLEKYKLSKKPEDSIQLKSVGSSMLFMKTEILKLGVRFTPYNAVGTTWDRSEGWEGLESESLCYQANTIGYTCWGFPNLVAYKAV